MEPRWLILADDLTGAADTAIAFARRRLAGESRLGRIAAAEIMWTPWRSPTTWPLVNVDAADAARRHGEVLRRFLLPGMRVFKKIDSTLRGHPAEEIAAMLDVMRAHDPRVRVVMAPAFPATGRTVRDGEVHVHGVPLPFTEYWPGTAIRRSPISGYLLESAGVHAHPVSLPTVRGPGSDLGVALGERSCRSATPKPTMTSNVSPPRA